MSTAVDMAAPVHETPSLASSQGKEKRKSACEVAALMMPDYRHDNPYQALLAKALSADGCRVDFPCGYRRVFPLFRQLRAFPDIQILHLHWTGQYLKGNNRIVFCGWAAKFLIDLLLVRWSGRRIVWTLHNTVPHESRFPRLELFTRRLIGKIASAMIVHGEAGRRTAVELLRCPAEKVFVVPQGNYIDAYPKAPSREQAREELRLDQRRRIFLFFGLIRPYKGLPALLHTWRDLDPHNAQLVIAGASENGYRQQIQSLTGEVPGVVWHNHWVPDEQLPCYFAAADVIVLPFERVLTSASVMLAMGFGKPVVAPSLGEIPETISGADDLAYCSQDPQGLKRSLQRALAMDLHDLECRTIAAARRFDWDEIGRKTAAIYRQVTAVNSSGAPCGGKEC